MKNIDWAALAIEAISYLAIERLDRGYGRVEVYESIANDLGLDEEELIEMGFKTR